MLNLIQHLMISTTYETLKRVQGLRLGLFTKPSTITYTLFKLTHNPLKIKQKI